MAEFKATKLKPAQGLFDTFVTGWGITVTGDVITTPGFATADTLTHAALGDFADKCVQVTGLTGAGSIKILGSNDPRVISDPVNAKWVTVKNLADADMTFTAANVSAGVAFGTIRDNFYFIKPEATGVVTGGLVVINATRKR